MQCTIATGNALFLFITISIRIQYCILCVCVSIYNIYQHACFVLHRAAAYSKLGNYAGAVQDCERAIGIDPNYSKAYGRMG